MIMDSPYTQAEIHPNINLVQGKETNSKDYNLYLHVTVGGLSSIVIHIKEKKECGTRCVPVVMAEEKDSIEGLDNHLVEVKFGSDALLMTSLKNKMFDEEVILTE